MRESFDAQSKESLEVLLEDVGTVVRGLDVAAAAQRFDLWFTPDPAHHDERMRRGLLGVLVDDPEGCALEPFRNTPDLAAVDDCVRRIANHRHHLALAAERQQPPTRPARPWVIVLSPGDPLSARVEYGLTTPEWPGVYRTPRGTGLIFVVLAELPVTRETLALRMLARGPTLKRAMQELAALPPDAWERKLVDVLLRWRRTIPETFGVPSQEEVEFMAATGSLFEEFQTENRNVGRNEGQFEVFTRQFERKLARALTAAERDVLRVRLLSQGHNLLSDLVIDLDATALAAWLAAPDAH